MWTTSSNIKFVLLKEQKHKDEEYDSDRFSEFLDEAEIFDIEEGTTYEYDVVDGEVSKWCVHDFGDVEVTDFRIYEYEERNILSISIYGK